MESIILTNLTPEDLKRLIQEAIKEAMPIAESKHEVKYLTRLEVCECLRISLPTLHEYTKRGIITGHRFGRRVLFKQTDIERAVHEIPSIRYTRDERR